MIAAGELATYDHSKELIKDEFQLPEGVSVHVVASFITGFVATTVASPFDLIKTRYCWYICIIGIINLTGVYCIYCI